MKREHITTNTRAIELLCWIVEFMDEHPEWTNENFTEDGNALSETEWLTAAREFINATQTA